ncbi:hypothetical protein JZO73_10275 [Enterococcus plantarum]|uniref:hypothetical protein n=1 Tax=Enterococcus plantarum TaxID=1077675 RepID=UPI001A903ADC|nr:hypothetical protein [Enterococcus plantarum]MBO0467916.1 hypothetical protein [Enterococcus plantarum]
MKTYEDRQYYVAMFVSRNKDNDMVEGFKQRSRAFLTQKTPGELLVDFKEFYERGVPNETCRFYISVNARKYSVIYKALQHQLIDQMNLNLTNIEKLIASLSMKNGTALTNKWLFDFDDDKSLFKEFISDLSTEIDGEILKIETPNGYAAVVEHGFDTRELLKKWSNVELKRDAMLFVTRE